MFLDKEMKCFNTFCQKNKFKSFALMQFKRTPIIAMKNAGGKFLGGVKGQMNIVEGEYYDTVVGSLANRGDTISKPYVFYLIKNEYYNLHQMLDLISSLSALHYNFRSVK
jgi:hypothetical protein